LPSTSRVPRCCSHEAAGGHPRGRHWPRDSIQSPKLFLRHSWRSRASHLSCGSSTIFGGRVSAGSCCVRAFSVNRSKPCVGDGSALELAVSYSQDWPNLMGTGGALKQALPLLDTQFLVLYGDSYLPVDFASVERVFLASGKPALMTVQAQRGQMGQSNVLFRDGVIVEYNKQSPRRK